MSEITNCEVLVMQNPEIPPLANVAKLTHTECVRLAAVYLNRRCPVILPEFFTFNAELPDVIGFRQRDSWVIECKVSRADFLKDALKQFRRFPEKGMGDVRYYCCPKNMIRKDELPDGWGLLYVYPSGQVREVKASKVFNAKNLEAEFHALFYYAKRAYYAGVHRAILDYRGFDK